MLCCLVPSRLRDTLAMQILGSSLAGGEEGEVGEGRERGGVGHAGRLAIGKESLRTSTN